MEELLMQKIWETNIKWMQKIDDLLGQADESNKYTELLTQLSQYLWDSADQLRHKEVEIDNLIQTLLKLP